MTKAGKIALRADGRLYLNDQYVYAFTTSARAKFTILIAKASKKLREDGIEILSNWKLTHVGKDTYIYEAETSKGKAVLEIEVLTL